MKYIGSSRIQTITLLQYLGMLWERMQKRQSTESFLRAGTQRKIELSTDLSLIIGKPVLTLLTCLPCCAKLTNLNGNRPKSGRLSNIGMMITPRILLAKSEGSGRSARNWNV